MKRTIVKVQQPLSSNAPIPGVLIYAEGRKCMIEQQPSPELLKALGRRPKAYFEGEWLGQHKGWSVGAEVPEQSW